jgi:hypothetical protein
MLKVSLQERLFCLFERHLPFELIIKYQRQLPKTCVTLDPVYLPHGGLGFTTNNLVEYKKTRTYRVAKSYGDAVMQQLQNKTFCFKCGHPDNCTKAKFRQQ